MLLVYVESTAGYSQFLRPLTHCEGGIINLNYTASIEIRVKEGYSRKCVASDSESPTPRNKVDSNLVNVRRCSPQSSEGVNQVSESRN